MRYFCLVFLSFLFCASLLPAEDIKNPAVIEIAGIIDNDEREDSLRKRLRDISSLDGRLLFLKEAARHESLRETADTIRKELLLLSGRTEEAEDLLSESGNSQSETALRLAINHGKIPLSRDKESARIPGLDLSSLTDMSENNPVSPEYFAARRGAIFSAAFLLSPESAGLFEEETSIGQGSDDLPDGADDGPGSISIQVGAFALEQNAAAHVEYLAGREISAEILMQESSDGTRVYKTVISGIPRSSAQRELVILKEKGIEGFILH